MKITNRIRGRRNTKRGSAIEQIAELWLKQKGYACVERIETPWRIHRERGKVVSATPKKKVSGDFTAIDPNTGRHVHVEVKSRDRDTLRWSDFEQHQIDAMDEKTLAGAQCLVMWIKSPDAMRIFEWPICGFGPRKSIPWDCV